MLYLSSCPRKQMLIRGGENIYCTLRICVISSPQVFAMADMRSPHLQEVEDVMYTHPALSDVALVGIPDDLMWVLT